MHLYKNINSNCVLKGIPIINEYVFKASKNNLDLWKETMWKEKVLLSAMLCIYGKRFCAIEILKYQKQTWTKEIKYCPKCKYVNIKYKVLDY